MYRFDDLQTKYYGLEYVEVGQTLRITCSMSRFIPPDWSVNESQLDPDDHRIMFEHSEGRDTNRMETLIIANVRPSDQGYYRCNSFTRQAHFVHVLPADGSIHAENGVSKTTVYLEQENSTVHLECRASIDNPYSSIYW